MYIKIPTRHALLILSMFLIIAFACNIPGAATPTPAPATAPAVDAGPSAEPVVQHTIIPVSLPQDRTSHAGDYDSSTTAGQREAAGGDRFTFGQYERPFNADTMDVYFPELDILDFLTYQDATWIYTSILMRGSDSNGELSGRYGLELDMDVNGKGDWLVLVSGPLSTEWSTDGVEVWQDTNRDVGGVAPMYTDDEPGFGDGFDRQVFGPDQQDDPDMAWARLSPDEPNLVQLAVKRSVFDNDETYLAGAWAGSDSLNPAMFDFNDHMTHTEAGAADRGLEIYYPIKALAELDASCRVAVGFAATGKEPGLCTVLIPTVPGCTLTAQQCYDQNMDYDSRNCRCVVFG